MHPPFPLPMPKQIALPMSHLGQPMHPGQQPGVLERGDRDAHTVATALRGPGESLVAREALSATIGAVEPPQQRFEHVQGGASEWPPMLAGLAIRAVVGRRRGPDPGLGVAVEPIGGRGPKDLSNARSSLLS
jgi:hypothetical protein